MSVEAKLSKLTSSITFIEMTTFFRTEILMYKTAINSRKEESRAFKSRA